MKNTFFLMVFVLISNTIFSQASKNINNYKYVIIPNTFDFLKEKDQYQVNSLTKFLFDKKFTAFLEDEALPQELVLNKCNALSINVVDNSGMFRTKLVLEAKNCVGDILFSAEGESKEKEYKKAYQMAIRDAYSKFEETEYSYEPIEAATAVTKNNEVKETVKIPVVIAPVIAVTPKPELLIKKNESTIETLYAQKKENGFQLINTTPEIILFIIKTKVEDVYIIKDKNGILYNNNGIWVAEYLVNNKMITKNYQIKF